MLHTLYGDETLSRSSVFKCYKQFKEGRKDLQGDPRNGRPSTPRTADTIANVLEMVTWDRRLTLEMMPDELNTNKETIRQILHEDLRRGKICAKSVPHRLADEQKQRRLASRQGFIQACQDNTSFLDCIFSFLRWKLPSKERDFKMLKMLREIWHLRSVFKIFLNDAINVFK
jgi:hypothetical protein